MKAKKPLSNHQIPENEHIGHLQNIGYGGALRRVVPAHIEDHFLKLGYIRSATGGTVITDGGHHALINWDETQ